MKDIRAPQKKKCYEVVYRQFMERGHLNRQAETQAISISQETMSTDLVEPGDHIIQDQYSNPSLDPGDNGRIFLSGNR